MADDVTYTATNPAGLPDATKQATDEHATRGHMPIVKLAYSADGDATTVPADVGGLLVNLGANNDVTVTGSLTDISGTVSLPTGASTAAAQATLLTELQLKADLTETQPVSLATVPSHAVTNAGVFATQVDGAALTALQLIDDSVQVLGTDVYTEATSKGITLGAVRRDADTTLASLTNEFAPLQVDANGRLKVEAFSGEALPVTMTSTTVTGTVAVTQSGTWDEVGINDSGNSITVDNAVLSVVGTGLEATAQRVTIASDSTGVLSVDDNGASLTVDNAQLSVVGTGTEAAAMRVTIASDSTGVLSVDDNGGALTVDGSLTTVSTVTTVTTLTGGGVAHDGADSGNPVKIGVKAVASTEGVTLVAANDRTDLYSDVDGILIVKQSCTNDDVVTERVTNTDGASTASTNFAAVASTHNCISAISLFNSSAAAVFIDFRDGTAGSVLWTMALPAGGGSIISCGNQPYLFRTTANTALAYDVSAATTTVYISVSGYQSKA